MAVKGEVGRSGIDWEFGINRSKLLHLEWIDNKVLLYSIGNYIQSLRIDHDGKYFLKEYIYILYIEYIYIYSIYIESIYLYIYIYKEYIYILYIYTYIYKDQLNKSRSCAS